MVHYTLLYANCLQAGVVPTVKQHLLERSGRRHFHWWLPTSTSHERSSYSYWSRSSPCLRLYQQEQLKMVCFFVCMFAFITAAVGIPVQITTLLCGYNPLQSINMIKFHSNLTQPQHVHNFCIVLDLNSDSLQAWLLEYCSSSWKHHSWQLFFLKYPFSAKQNWCHCTIVSRNTVQLSSLQS